MNTNSYLCRFLADHPDQWATLLWKDYRIRAKEEDGYAIFNYSFDCDFSDPLVQEARGIILDTEKKEVVCWPFRKFGNHYEHYADPIDWSQAQVLEKVDGSIIKLWYDRKKPGWQFSTNAMLRSEHAPVDEFSLNSFYHLICRADNFGDIPFDSLDKDTTYIFELVSPSSQVVVPYETTTLYHIGTRNNLTGQESDPDIGIRKPKKYPIHSLGECVETAVRLNQTEVIQAEGFVVVDGNWNRVKVKSPDYIARHQLVQIKSVPKRECVQMLLEGSAEPEAICGANPEMIPMFKFYEYHLARLRHLADKLGFLAQQLYEEYSHDRSAVAKVIQKHALSWVGFHCMTNDRKGSEVLMQMPLEKLCRLIPEYQEEDLSLLFLEV